MEHRLYAAVFDLDGTLIDSMGVWERIDREFLRRRGLAVDPEYLTALKSMNYSRAADYTIRRFNLSETPEAIMAEWDRMAEWEYGHNIPLKPGAKELLAELRLRRIQLAIATMAGPRLYRAVLKHHELEGFFSACTDASVGLRGKDYPDIYLQAARLLHTEPEHCIVFEDLLLGLTVAKKAGFVTCAVEDASSVSQKEQLSETADYYVRSLTEMPEALMRRFGSPERGRNGEGQ